MTVTPSIDPARLLEEQLAGLAIYRSINAAAETFWSTLKSEFYGRHHWSTKTEAKRAVGAWSEDRYNRRRRHSSIGMISPVGFETEHHQTAPAA